MYSSHIRKELAHARIDDEFARAEAHRLAARARPAHATRRLRHAMAVPARRLARMRLRTLFS